MDNYFDLTSFRADLMSTAAQNSSSNDHGQHLPSLTTMPALYSAQPQPLSLQYPANNIYIPQHLPYVEPPPLVEPSTTNNGVDMIQGSSSVSVYIPQHLPYVEPPPLIEPTTANDGVDMTQGSSSVSVDISQHLPYVGPSLLIEPSAANDEVDMTQGSSSVSVYIPQHLPYVEPLPLIEPSTTNNGVDMTQGSSSVSVYMEPGNSCGELLPPGYRFNPKDEELILHYLMKKVSNQPLPCDYIIDVDVYKCTPWDLAEKLMLSGDKKGFCFTPIDRKYARGRRPNRRAIDGYWKASGAEQKIKYNHRKPYRDNVYGDMVYGDVIGTKRALVFYRGRPPKGDKTQWIMHEYNLYNEDHKRDTAKGTAKDMRLHSSVLCSLYYKGKTLKGSSHHDNVNEPMGMLDFNHNNDNVQEPSSSTEYKQEVERPLDGCSERCEVPPNNSDNHIHNHNADSFEEGLMKFLNG